MIRFLLWDVDGTLLDFKAAERAAVIRLFEEFSLGPCTEEMVRRYSRINETFWQRLERNEISKRRVLTGRFEQFFREIGVPVSLAEEFNRRYQLKLGDTLTIGAAGFAGISTVWGIRLYTGTAVSVLCGICAAR